MRSPIASSKCARGRCSFGIGFVHLSVRLKGSAVRPRVTEFRGYGPRRLSVRSGSVASSRDRLCRRSEHRPACPTPRPTFSATSARCPLSNRNGRQSQSSAVARPRNQQARTAVSRRGGGRFLLYERADLGQGANNNDVAVPRARPGVNFGYEVGLDQIVSVSLRAVL